MAIGRLELQRARRALEVFCAHRNSLRAGPAAKFTWRQEADSLFVGQLEPTENEDAGTRFVALVRLDYRDGQWLLFWPQAGGEWRAYPHLPRALSIEAVVEELEQAPLHVHWE